MFFSFSSIGNGKWYEGILQILFENNYEKVYKTALSITLNEETAKDAAQEAFLKAFLKIDTLKNKDKFGAWISSIVVNVCKDMLRKNITRINRDVSIFDEDGYLKNNIIEMYDFNTPERAYLDCEAKQELQRCIEELDIDEQRIINLRYYNGLTYEQIANLMDMKISTVGMKIFRAKEKIIKRLKKYLDIKEYENDGQGY